MDPRRAFDEVAPEGQRTVEVEDEYDFSRSNESSNLLPLEEQPLYKYFFLQLVGVDKVVQATKFYNTQCGDIFSKIGRTLMLEDGSFSIEYRIHKVSGKTETVTVLHNQDPEILTEVCELMYSQARSNDTLFINRVKKREKNPSRKKKKSEVFYIPFYKKIGVQHLVAYEDLASRKHLITSFIRTLTNVRVLLGNASCVNLLNPCKFLCPVKSCRKKTALGSFNKLHLVLRHLTNHKIKKNKLGEILCDRYDFLQSHDWFESRCSEKTGAEMIEEMEQSKPELSVSGFKLAYVFKGGKYCHNSRHIDEEILDDLLNDNYSRLSEIKNSPSVKDMFARAKSKQKQKQQQKQKAQGSKDDDDNKDDDGDESDVDVQIFTSSKTSSKNKKVVLLDDSDSDEDLADDHRNDYDFINNCSEKRKGSSSEEDE